MGWVREKRARASERASARASGRTNERASDWIGGSREASEGGGGGWWSVVRVVAERETTNLCVPLPPPPPQPHPPSPLPLPPLSLSSSSPSLYIPSVSLLLLLLSVLLSLFLPTYLPPFLPSALFLRRRTLRLPRPEPPSPPSLLSPFPFPSSVRRLRSVPLAALPLLSASSTIAFRPLSPVRCLPLSV